MASEIITSFLEMMAAERGASANTAAAYEHDLKEFMAFLSAGQPRHSLESADETALHRYAAHMAGAGLSPSTSARRISSLRQFYHFLYSDGLRKDNPAAHLETPKQAETLPRYLDEGEVSLLLAKAHEDNSAEGMRLTALLEVLYASGLRVTELLTLKYSAIQRKPSQQGDVYFLSVRGKGGRERIAPLNASAMSAMKAYLACRTRFLGKDRTNSYLFPSRAAEGHLTRQRLGQMLKELAVKAGIDPEKISPHVLRHSFASHLLHNGMDLRVLQELLGHADISTTQIYTHIANDKLKSLVENHHPLARKSARYG